MLQSSDDVNAFASKYLSKCRIIRTRRIWTKGWGIARMRCEKSLVHVSLSSMASTSFFGDGIEKLVKIS
jgi:hypothetical protein